MCSVKTRLFQLVGTETSESYHRGHPVEIEVAFGPPPIPTHRLYGMNKSDSLEKEAKEVKSNTCSIAVQYLLSSVLTCVIFLTVTVVEKTRKQQKKSTH